MVERRTKAGKPGRRSAKREREQRPARKDQKRREAELRAQTQPLRKEIARLEKEMEKLNAQLAQAEEKLGDSELYDQSRKAELTACLQQQASAKSGWKSAKWRGWKPVSSLSRCCWKAKATDGADNDDRCQ